MKCINCGANYDGMMSNCPYCNTANGKSAFFTKRKKVAQDQMNNMTNAMKPYNQIVTFNAVLNRILIIEAIIIVLFFVLTAVIGVIDGNRGYGVARDMSKREAKELVKHLYEEEDFAMMTRVYQEADLYGEDDMKLYSSMASFYMYYRWFVEARIEYMDGVKMEDVDDYTINSLIRYMHEVLRGEESEYNDEYDIANEKYFEPCREDVVAFATGVLKLNDDEIEQLKAQVIYNDEETAIRKAIKQRRGQGYAE